MPGLLMENDHFEMGLAPVADFAAADTETDVVNMNLHDTVRFIVVWGVGTTGVIKFTVDACDDVVPTNTAKIPFWYRITAAGGTPGTVTLADKDTGVSNTAGSDQIIEIEVRHNALAASGYNYVRLVHDETTDDPILGGTLIQMGNPRFAGTVSSGSAVT